MEEFDRFDTLLLREMQRDARQTSDALADIVGLSPTAVQRRLKRLRHSGVIEKEVAILDPEEAGGWLTLIVEIEIERGSADILDGFKRRMRKTPEVQQCYYVAGDCDFILIVTARTMADYETFTRRVFFDDLNVRKFKTIVVMDVAKLGLELPV